MRRFSLPTSIAPILLSFVVPVGVGCGSDPNQDSNAGTGGLTGQGGASGGVAGNPGISGSGGVAAGAGAGGASAGMSGGSAGAGGGSAGAGTGGSAGSSGNSGAGGTGGGAGSGGNSSGLKGGASGKFVCTPGATYGDPLAGMGAVTEFKAPMSGPVTYFAFIEGPVWIGSRNTLFFSDNVSPERIWKLVPPATTPELALEMSGSNGLAIDGNDQLIVADQAGKRIARRDPAMPSIVNVVVPAGNFTPNDVVVRSDGNVYFTDPNSGGRGFYRADPSGAVTGPLTAVNAPNGIVLSPDESTLYVGDVGNRTISKFSVAADGSVAATATPFVTATGNTVDGLCVDCAGNVYAGTQSGVEVFSAAGARLGTVPTGEASNCTFGGTDRKTLYVTSRAVLKAVTLAVPGLPD